MIGRDLRSVIDVSFSARYLRFWLMRPHEKVSELDLFGVVETTLTGADPNQWNIMDTAARSPNLRRPQRPRYLPFGHDYVHP